MLELQRNVFVIRRWWWLLLLGAVIGGLVAFGLTRVLAKNMYEARAVISSGPAPQGQQGAYFASGGSAGSAQLVPNAGVLDAAQRAVPGLDRGTLARDLDGTASQQDCVSVRIQIRRAGCQLITIGARWTDGPTAIKLANAVAAVFLQQQKQSLAQGYTVFHQVSVGQERALANLVRSTPGKGAAGDWLQAQYANAIAKLYQADAAQHVSTLVAQTSLQVADPATFATKVSGPRAAVTGALGALLGLLIAWVIAFLATSSYGDNTAEVEPRAVFSQPGN